jgi:hypothetical protein
VTAKVLVVIVVPPGVVTVRLPVVAVVGTSALMVEAVFEVIMASTPLKLMDAARRPLPEMVTTVPGAPEVGLKPPTAGVGEGLSVKEAVEVAAPPGVVTAR